jgi:hypothetical protein
VLRSKAPLLQQELFLQRVLLLPLLLPLFLPLLLPRALRRQHRRSSTAQPLSALHQSLHMRWPSGASVFAVRVFNKDFS